MPRAGAGGVLLVATIAMDCSASTVGMAGKPVGQSIPNSSGLWATIPALSVLVPSATTFLLLMQPESRWRRDIMTLVA